MRIGDLEPASVREERYAALREKHLRQLAQFDYKLDLEQPEQEFAEGIRAIERCGLIDSEQYVNDALDSGRTVLAEGAQGTMLDVDFGTYPFVTSSNTVCAGACTGLGVAPTRIGRVMGIFKAYCTRVSNAPFPTELFDDRGETMRNVGVEYGSTTGRPRRCGWLDMVALKYAVMINGATGLIMMKADVLSGFDTIEVCTGYRQGDKVLTSFPYEYTADMAPVYRRFEGWKCDISGARSYSELPAALKTYIEFIETECSIPVEIVSVGPDRDQTIVR